MAFGRLQRSVPHSPMSEINMTPLIDVMLVLLVIFMVAAPLMSASLSLELPSLDTAQPIAPPHFITVSIDAQGLRYLDNQRLTDEALLQAVQALAAQPPLPEVHLRADSKVPYGRVAQTLDILQKAGLTRIGFIANPVLAPTPP